MNFALRVLQLSSLEKVFPEDNPGDKREIYGACALRGERVSYQILYTGGAGHTRLMPEILADDCVKVSLRTVGTVPVAVPLLNGMKDEYYLKDTPGEYPDVLWPLDPAEGIDCVSGVSQSLFVTLEVASDAPAGMHPVTVTFRYRGGELTRRFELEVLPVTLPKQTLTFTEWFHADCIASVYQVPVFSEAHWELIDKYMAMAAHIGLTMLLTPIFTLPLDTGVGLERPTCQLVDVWYRNGKYTFGFSRLERWIALCRKNGIEKLEISHLFSQWGTGFAPKIVAQTEKVEEKIFGWHTPITGPEYGAFLQEFLPQLVAFLKEQNIWENSLFHISDEPSFPKDVHVYSRERALVENLIPAEKITDALSHTEFCDMGYVKTPVSGIASLQNFIDRGYSNFWAYYCCGPCDGGYTNRYVAMPSYRNRIIGLQLYKYNVAGFLHWGFNFYYAIHSKAVIDPFSMENPAATFPNGDAYAVYPGPEGPVESLRSAVFYEGLEDLSVCRALEEYIGREAVVALLEEDGELTFNQFPHSETGVLSLRDKLNNALRKACKG